MDLNDFKKKPVIRKIEVGRVIEAVNQVIKSGQ